MTNSAALSGDYVDLRFIKSRKVCQIVIEIPIEQGSAFVQSFGTPNPATTIPVAIARLQEGTEKPKRQWGELAPAQQAGIACGEPDFRRFLAHIGNYDDGLMLDPNTAANEVRRICYVKSRSDLNTDHTARMTWNRLYSDYQLWKRGAAV